MWEIAYFPKPQWGVSTKLDTDTTAAPLGNAVKDFAA
jgi:hypothetical protein